MTRDTIAVVPARNEADRLPSTVEALAGLPGVCRIVVADDGSTDGTACIALRAGAEVVVRGGRGDKGRALISGLTRARLYNPDAILLADADLGASAAELGRLIETLSETRPFVVANFPASGIGGGFGLVKRAARAAIRRCTGFTPLEPLSGQRALLTGTLERLPGLAPGFGVEVGMTLDLLRAGVTPLEAEVTLRHRATGRTPSGFAHRGRQGLDILRAAHGTRILW